VFLPGASLLFFLPPEYQTPCDFVFSRPDELLSEICRGLTVGRQYFDLENDVGREKRVYLGAGGCLK
jgi:hypothetical protein